MLATDATVGCQHTMVAMAVHAWRRDQGGKVVEELQRGEGELGAAVALGLGKTDSAVSRV